MVHGNVHQYGAGTAAHGQVESALHDAWKVVDSIDTIDALTERTAEFELSAIQELVDLLVWVPPEEVGRNIASDHHHRNRIERRIGDAGHRIREAGAQVRHQDARLSRYPRISLRGMSGHLLVAG